MKCKGSRRLKSAKLMTLYSIIHDSSATNERTKEKVAIKKLHRPFQSEIFAKRAYRELRLLKHMKHENVSRLQVPISYNKTVDSKSLSVFQTRWLDFLMCSHLPWDSMRCRTCEYWFPHWETPSGGDRQGLRRKPVEIHCVTRILLIEAFSSGLRMMM